MAEQPSIGGQEAVTGVALANLNNGWKPVRFFGLVLVIGFSIAQLSLVFDRIHRITPQPIFDGVHYLGMASGFFTGSRRDLFTNFFVNGLYPVFLAPFDAKDMNLLGPISTHPKLFSIYAAQAVFLSVTSFVLLLALFFWCPGSTTRRMVITGFLGVLLLSPLFLVWPAYVLTESVAIPVLLLLLASFLAYDAKPSIPRLTLIAALAPAVALTRDPMIYFVVLTGVLLMANVALRSPRFIGTAIVAWFIVISCGFALIKNSAKHVGPVYGQDMANVIQIRILPDPDRRAFFIARGMPIGPTVIARAGKPAYLDKWFDSDTELKDYPDFVSYRAWILNQGMKTYAAFLASHPLYLIKSFWQTPNLHDAHYGGDIDLSIADLFSVPVSIYGTDLIMLPNSVRRFLLAPFGWLLSFGFVALCAVRYVDLTWRRLPTPALEIAALAGFVSIIMSYHLESLDPWRHSLPFLIVIYVAMIVRGSDLLIAEAARWRLSSQPGGLFSLSRSPCA